MTGYAQTRRDYVYLDDIKNVDVTADFADFWAVDFLLNPSKKYFQEQLATGIQQWFDENKGYKFNRRMKGIIERHDIYIHEEN